MGHGMLSKFESFVRKISNWFANIGAAMLLLICLITFLDIVGSKFFALPFPGSVELTGFLQTMLIPFAAAITLLYGQHIKVEIFTDRLPEHVKAIIDSVISLLLCLFILVLIWQTVVFAIAIQTSGEYSNTLRLPLSPVIYIMAFALISLCLAFLLGFLQLFKGKTK
jgi:TRAP-type C4-dicarboxylate transport system permease small subunit